MKGAAKGALPGLALGQTIADTMRYAKSGKYGQAALAAGGGIAGLALGPVAATALPAGAAAINYCIDNPEECKKFLTGAGSERAFKKGKEKVTSDELLRRKLSKQIGQLDLNETPDRPQTFSASPDLIKSIIDVESGGRADAVSPKGALGRMQVMPATAKDPGFGIKPAQNFSSQELERVGQDYFNAMLNKYGGDKRKALIAYNMGPGAADRWLSQGGEVSNLPKETQAYVPKVLSKYRQQTSPAGTGAVSLQSPDRSGQINQKQTTNIKPNRKSSSIRGVYTANPNWTKPPGPEFFKSNF